jgi:hypothetical protein
MPRNPRCQPVEGSQRLAGTRALAERCLSTLPGLVRLECACWGMPVAYFEDSDAAVLSVAGLDGKPYYRAEGMPNARWSANAMDALSGLQAR